MNMITCKCKKSQKNFVHLKPSDLPEGWEGECCLEVEVAPKAPLVSAQAAVKMAEAEMEAGPEADMTVVAPEEDSLESMEAGESAPKEDKPLSKKQQRRKEQKQAQV